MAIAIFRFSHIEQGETPVVICENQTETVWAKRAIQIAAKLSLLIRITYWTEINVVLVHENAFTLF
jgi:hypothetical protein